MNELEKLPNLGKVVAGQLRQVGIETQEQLRETGARAAWLKILEIDNSACYNRLCALEGALRGIRWHDLPLDTKTELKDFYRTAKHG